MYVPRKSMTERSHVQWDTKIVLATHFVVAKNWNEGCTEWKISNELVCECNGILQHQEKRKTYEISVTRKTQITQS